MDVGDPEFRGQQRSTPVVHVSADVLQGKLGRSHDFIVIDKNRQKSCIELHQGVACKDKNIYLK